MSTDQTLLEDQQTSAGGGPVVSDDGATENATYSLVSDVNKNKVDGEKRGILISGEGMTRGVDDQDSLNNNENCNLMCGQLSCKAGCGDHDRTVGESLAEAALSSREIAIAKEKRLSSRRSNRNKKNCNEKASGFSSAGDVVVSPESKSTDCAHELSTPEVNAIHEQRNQRQLLREYLFSVIREEFEKTEDVRMLPTCLHQIAETYFQEEDYEKAMQFIQLERIYHEQLLANLSAIQEQWETKWKATGSSPLPSPQISEKGLSSKELEKLSSLCGSHQNPKISKQKLSASEKSLKIQSLSLLVGSDGIPDVGEPTDVQDRERRVGSRPRKDRKPGGAEMTENLPPNLTEADTLVQAAEPGHSHSEELQLHSSGAALQSHTQSTGAEGRANPDSFSSGDAGKHNNLLQPEATSLCHNVPGIATFSKDFKEVPPGTPMVDKLIPASTGHSGSCPVAPDNASDSKLSLDSSRSPIQTAQVAQTAAENCKGIGERELASATSIKAEAPKEEAFGALQDTAPQKCLQDAERAAQRQATVEFLASLLNGSLKDSEELLTHLDFQEETLSEEEMSPSPGDSCLGDNLISLDELAKRIEIEEINPAAGLVSILKKRDGNEGDKFAQKPTKRKVRFQEMDDALDQEEIGGGSCILLVALCIVTVFLSIGGTAVYCTFGDVDSSVCKDFTENMDFYYTQLLQGIEELKHCCLHTWM
ncbi:consortin [Bombina bombina]|uniref:consortin n=1 Tax=Bombina bombina TaxID=8345 RepID=UPI00235ACB1B|nr:consortin [Bombina bombina]XP_053567021.1 consortin [Bombina bombina]